MRPVLAVCRNLISTPLHAQGPGSSTSNFRAKVTMGAASTVALPDVTFEGVLCDHFFNCGKTTEQDMEVVFSHAFVPDLFEPGVVHQYLGVATISKVNSSSILPQSYLVV